MHSLLSCSALDLSGSIGSGSYRRIHFEQYRKSSVVEYPPRSVVLNPQHTRQYRAQHLGDLHGDASGKYGVSLEEKRQKGEHKKTEDDADGDPMRMKRSSFLCSDKEFRHVLQLRWKEVGRMGRGIENLGNTCFLNAVLQCFAYTPALSQYFTDNFKLEECRIGAPYDFAFVIGETLRDILALSRVTSSSSSNCRPVKIVNHLPQLSPHFRRGCQSDAHEFAMQLLSHAQKSILYRLVENTKLPHAIAATSPLLRICGGYLMSQVCWKRKDEVEELRKKGKKQMAKDLEMEGRNEQARRRMEGHDSFSPLKANISFDDNMFSTTYDPMTILSVELAGQTLEHCLQKFFEKEQLDGRCYHTPRQVGVRAYKQFKIHVPPNVLIIQIKRFSPTGGKEGKKVRYPLQLDLNHFCSPKSQELGPHRYTLNAFCIHSGYSINSGHYYAVVQGRNDSWYECNDSHVRMISESEALSQEAYMLFYSRTQPYGMPRDESRERNADGNRGAFDRGSRAGSLVSSPAQPSLKGKRDLVPFSIHSENDEEETLGKHVSEEEVERWKASKKQGKNSNQALQADTSAAKKTVSLTPMVSSCFPSSSHSLSLRQDTEEESAEEKLDTRDEERVKKQEKKKLNMCYPVLSSHSSKPPPGSVIRDTVAIGKNRDLLSRAEYSGRPSSTLPTGSHQWEGAYTRPQKSVTRLDPSSPLNSSLAILPVTLQRSSHLPKFQQKIRDPLWEMQMDQGRQKKVKLKNSEISVTGEGDNNDFNPFQKVAEGRAGRQGKHLRN